MKDGWEYDRRPPLGGNDAPDGAITAADAQAAFAQSTDLFSCTSGYDMRN